MRLLIQSVEEATVVVDEANINNKIWKGLLIYIWISKEDLENYDKKIEKIVRKLSSLRFFTNKDGTKIDQSLFDVDGEILLISNFTLYGRNRKWTKIDFMKSADFQDAEKIYNLLIEKIHEAGISLKTGEFGWYMKISSILHWPLNYVLDF